MGQSKKMGLDIDFDKIILLSYFDHFYIILLFFQLSEKEKKNQNYNKKENTI